MGTCSRLSMLLILVCINSSKALKAQAVRVDPKVTGYLDQNVTLPCSFIRGSPDSVLNQVNWELMPPEVEGAAVLLILFNPRLGVHIPEGALKKRVTFANKSSDDFSLIIRDVKMADRGIYTCRISTFPHGTSVGTTNLTVTDQPPPVSSSAGMVAGIVTAVILLFVIIVATAYLIIIRKRHEALLNHTVSIGASALVADVGKMPAREVDLVYAGIVVKSTRRRDSAPSTDDKQLDTTHADDVTYSEVAVGHHQRRGGDYAHSGDKEVTLPLAKD